MLQVFGFFGSVESRRQERLLLQVSAGGSHSYLEACTATSSDVVKIGMYDFYKFYEFIFEANVGCMHLRRKLWYGTSMPPSSH